MDGPLFYLTGLPKVWMLFAKWENIIMDMTKNIDMTSVSLYTNKMDRYMIILLVIFFQNNGIIFDLKSETRSIQ